jgi:hypothetical protein
MRSIPVNRIDQCSFSGRNTSPDWSWPNRCIWVTTAPAATIELLNDTIVHYYCPCQYIVFNYTTMHDCIVSNWNIITYDCGMLLYVQWIIAPSWILTLLPIWMKFTSPLISIKPNTTRFSKTYITNNSSVFSNIAILRYEVSSIEILLTFVF